MLILSFGLILLCMILLHFSESFITLEYEKVCFLLIYGSFFAFIFQKSYSLIDLCFHLFYGLCILGLGGVFCVDTFRAIRNKINGKS